MSTKKRQAETDEWKVYSSRYLPEETLYKQLIFALKYEGVNLLIFKKLFEGNTVEQQALNSVIAKKKLQEQEKQIRELIIWAYGTETYQEMIMLRRQIKARREQVIYKQRKRQRLIMDSTVIVFGALIIGAIIFGTVSLIQGVN